MTEEQKNKAVEEMALVLNRDYYFTMPYATEVVTILWKAGYRKQSDTVKEFAEKVTELDGHIRECCMQSFCDMVDIIAAEFDKEVEK